MDSSLSSEHHDELVFTEKGLKSGILPGRAFLGLYLATFILRVGFSSTVVLIPLYLERHLHLQHIFIWATLVQSTYLVAELIFAGYFGHKSDTGNTRIWLQRSMIVATAVMLLYGIVYFEDTAIIILPAITMALYIAFIHLIHGVAAAAKVSPSIGYISRFSDYTNRASRMGMYDSSVFLARVVGVVMAGVLYSKWVGEEILVVDGKKKHIPINPEHIFWIYLVMAVFIIIGYFVLKVTLYDTAPDIDKEELDDFSFFDELTTSFRELKDADQRAMITPWLAMSTLLGLVNSWLFYILSAGETAESSATTVAVIGLGFGLPTILWGFVADRIGRKKTLMIGVFGMVTFALLLSLYTLTGILDVEELSDSFVSSPLVMITLTLPFLMVSAFPPSIMGRLGDSSEIDEESHRATSGHSSTMSLYHVIIAVGELGGLAIGGLALTIVFIIDDQNWGAATIVTIILIGLLLIATALTAFSLPSDEEFIKKRSSIGLFEIAFMQSEKIDYEEISSKAAFIDPDHCEEKSKKINDYR
ncbi:MAG: MFS transporter [Candidatus Kariarchaeaceae archaeon]